MEMLKNALIVDDNEMIIEALSKIINWENNGFRLIGKAYNGLEALTISRELEVDVLITDIKMPEMDGLELIKIIKTEQPDVKVVVLSAYNEFSLVREAFKLGASEFMLKSELDPSFLSNLLISLSKEQDEGKEEKLSFVNLSAQVQRYDEFSRTADRDLYQNGRLIRDRLLNELVRGYITPSEIVKQKRDYIRLRLFEGSYAIMYLSIDNYKPLLKQGWESDEKLLTFAVLNVIDEILDRYGTGDCFEVSNGEFCIIFSFNLTGEVSESPLDNTISEIFNELSSTAEKVLKLKISGGASIQRGQNNLQELYAEANQACQLRVIYGRGSMIFSGPNMKRSVKNDLKPSDRLEYLKNTLASMNPEVIRKGIENLIVNPASISFGDFEEVIHLYQKYSLVLFDFIEQNGLEKECREYMDKFDSYIFNMSSVAEMNKWLRATIEAVSKGLVTGNSLIRQFKKYINEHFNEGISLQNVADFAGVSSSYLSKLVVKELGVSFTDYLNSYRIERAKDLIQNSNMKIYEIAERVGYGSIEHFSRVFKKNTGKSPKEYASGS